MALKTRKLVKGLFMRLPYVRLVQFLTALPLVRMEVKRFPAAVRFDGRFDMYAWLAVHLAGATVSYLEFGVYKGASIKEWARLLPGADHRFVGFDSFEGLPEDWDHVFATTRKGTFAMGGQLPSIADGRISFVKGWFNDTLPQFARQLNLEGRRLVIHLDADLYSSTSFVLHELNPLLKAGTILVFDEFGSPLHEYRALMDWAATYRREFRIDSYVGDTVDQAAITLL